MLRSSQKFSLNKILLQTPTSNAIFLVFYNVYWILLLTVLAFDNEKTIMSERRGVGCFSKEIYAPEFCYFKYEVYKKKY